MRISRKSFKRLTLCLPLLLATATFAFSIAAQTTTAVDPTFNAIPDKNPPELPNFAVQPDGKIVVFGNFQTIYGALRSQTARFNQDGSSDNSFVCAVCSFIPNSVVPQADGKILVSGALNNGLQAVVYRLNADGSRDAGFTSPFEPLAPPNGFVDRFASATINAVQPDGKILVTLNGYFSGTLGYTLYRLDTDGSFDPTFTATSIGGGRLSPSIPQKVGLLPDGKILVAATSNGGAGVSSYLFRINRNGTADATFDAPAILGDGGSVDFVRRSRIYDFDINADGSYVVVGEFTTVNALSRRNAVKILPAGNVDPSFNVADANVANANRVEILPDGKVLIGTANQISRYNADGSLDASFAAPTNLTQINRWTLDAANRVVLLGAFAENGAGVNRFARLNQNGALESSFTANFGVAALVTTVAAQTDGKVLFSGDFIRVNGAPRTSIVRVNADGSTDATFNSGSGFSGAISKIIEQPDGKIIVAGGISSYNGATRFGIARLNSDGTLDPNFTVYMTFAGSAAINAVALQADGKILVGGSFNTVDGQARTGIARLNADGRLDAGFNPTFGNPFVANIIWQPDGKILVGGTFNGVNGFSRSNLARLNADGSLDSSFNAGSNFFGTNQIAIQADGKYLVSGGSNIIRLNQNGTIDAGFSSPSFQSASSNGSPLVFLAQPDGTILVGGGFSSVNGVTRQNLVRLRPTGALDTGFLPTGANGFVRTIVRQANGQILVGGDFSVIGGVARLSVARLNVAAFRPVTPFDYDGDGRADVAVFRPANGNWYVLPSQTGSFYGFPFGQAGDQIAPADYDGDGKTDIAVFRETVQGAGDKAYFYVFNSSDNSFRPVQFGTQGDVPVPGDWDGDGRADFAVFRRAPATGGLSYFYYRPSAQPAVDYVTIGFSSAGDKPVPADYDGDGRLDPATVQTNGGTGVWRILYSSTNQIGQIFFGVTNDVPVPADFDGDGRANIAVFRPSNGTWYTTQNAANNFGAVQFGQAGDLPVAADYDGDGRADVAVFRPSNGAWYLNRSTSGFTGVQFGASGDRPSPNAFAR